jgi:hypothetical protein
MVGAVAVDVTAFAIGQAAYYRTTAPCVVHKQHTPKSHINEIHHVWPKGDGGPDIPQNRIVVCATGHNNIHALIDLYRKAWKDGQREPTFLELSHWGASEQKVAALGWQRIQQQRM